MSVQTDKRVLNKSYCPSEISGSQSPALHQLVCLYVCPGWNVMSTAYLISSSATMQLSLITTRYVHCVMVNHLDPPYVMYLPMILRRKCHWQVFLSKNQFTIVTYHPFAPPYSINSYESCATNQQSICYMDKYLLLDLTMLNHQHRHEPNIKPTQLIDNHYL
ncbi:uncharacterized protein LOC119672451 [Teleopsis dalmanni]|uniref:uncharacterized protein LOC119672451 n=1 Tax=Teleopsis dalmanni TaxID=139649 RepID=UPI0018CDF405|nr:uncharacterized protein LOC119672451 [Teleopsis dalmanni]XP_037939433.1 uncharacterized protein LOC119672451 [Teleopsis dalmanni]